MSKKTQKVLDCIAFIDSQNLTCDELSRLLSEVEDIKWSDYDVGYDDSDRSDELREYRENQ